MARVKPFRCIRPAKELAHRIAALPYDVYEQKKKLRRKLAGNPYPF